MRLAPDWRQIGGKLAHPPVRVATRTRTHVWVRSKASLCQIDTLAHLVSAAHALPHSKHEAFAAYEQTRDCESADLTLAIDPDIALEIDQRNGWCEPNELSEQAAGEVDFLVIKAFFELFREILGDDAIDAAGVRPIIHRFFTLASILQPDLLRLPNGAVATLDDLALVFSQPINIKCTACWLSMISEAYATKHNFQGSAMKTQSARESYTKAASAYWARIKGEQEVRRRRN